jgi:hypothetical protein
MLHKDTEIKKGTIGEANSTHLGYFSANAAKAARQKLLKKLNDDILEN